MINSLLCIIYLVCLCVVTYKTHTIPHSNNWLTFVHGASADASVWDYQISYFNQFYNILVIDFTGVVDCISDQEASNFSFKFLSEEIVEILNENGIEKSHFVGMCLGNMIVRELLEEHKDRVGATVMASAILRFNLAFTIVLYTHLLLEKIIHYKVLYAMMIYLSTPFRSSRPSRKHFLKNFSKVSRSGYLLWLRLAKQNNIPIHFYNAIGLRTEVLFIGGSRDYLILPYLKRFVKTNKLALLKIIPKGGHAINIDQKELFNKEVHGYLKNQEEANYTHVNSKVG